MTGPFVYSIIIILSAFEYRGGEPASLFPLTSAAESYTVPAIYLNPLSVAGGSGGTISAYITRPYSEEALHSYTSGIKYSGEDWGFQFMGHSFGTDFYKENRFSAAAGLSPFKILNTGLSISAYKLDIDTDEESLSRTIYDGDIAAALSPFNWITIAFMHNSIYSAATGSNRDEIYPELSAGVVLKPFPGFTLSWNNTDTAAGHINIFSAGISPASFIHLKGGYSPEDTRLAASITVLLKTLSVTYSLSSHPYLGYTHSFGVTLSSLSDIETIRYSTPAVFTNDKKVNLNTASPEEIKKIPGLSERSSERIVLYRSKLGPVSEKALRRIGLDSDEIKSVKRNCYGLARDSNFKNDESLRNSPFKKNKAFIPPKERIRERFRIMIRQGIPASTAIRYSEIPESARRGEIESLLSDDTTLSDEQKDIIRKACSR